MVLTPWGMLHPQKPRDEVGSVPEDFLEPPLSFLGKGSPSAASDIPTVIPASLLIPVQAGASLSN